MEGGDVVKFDREAVGASAESPAVSRIAQEGARYFGGLTLAEEHELFTAAQLLIAYHDGGASHVGGFHGALMDVVTAAQPALTSLKAEVECLRERLDQFESYGYPTVKSVLDLAAERDEFRRGMDFLKEEAALLRGERDMLKTTAKWSVPLGKAEESLKCIVEKLLWDLSMPTEYIEGKRDKALAAFRAALSGSGEGGR